jgi:hypothetical protein
LHSHPFQWTQGQNHLTNYNSKNTYSQFVRHIRSEVIRKHRNLW